MCVESIKFWTLDGTAVPTITDEQPLRWFEPTPTKGNVLLAYRPALPQLIEKARKTALPRRPIKTAITFLRFAESKNLSDAELRHSPMVPIMHAPCRRYSRTLGTNL